MENLKVTVNSESGKFIEVLDIHLSYDAAFAIICNYMQANGDYYTTVNGEIDWVIQEPVKMKVHSMDGGAVVFEYGSNEAKFNNRILKIERS